ncbi:flippase-like domain-containing protein [Thermococcus sp.]
MDKKKASFLAFGLLMILLLIKWAGLGDVIEVLKGARPDYFLLAILAYIAGILLWAFRWRVLLKSLNINAPFKVILGALFAGIFVNNVTPGARGGGEPVRMYYLSKRSNGEYGPVLATVMADRVLDLIPTIIMILISTVYVYTLGSWSLTLILLALDILLAVLIITSMAILLNEGRTKRVSYWIFNLLSRIMPKKTKKYEKKFIHMIEVNVPKFQGGFKLLMRDKKSFLLALSYSFMMWFLILLRSYYVFYSLNYQIRLLDVMVVQMVGIVIGLVSIIPGGAGLIETVNSAVYVLLGIDKEIAVTATLVERLISYWAPTFLGGVIMAHFGIKVTEEKKGLTGKGENEEKETVGDNAERPHSG